MAEVGDQVDIRRGRGQRILHRRLRVTFNSVCSRGRGRVDSEWNPNPLVKTDTMKTKILTTLGAVAAACALSSCDVYSPGYAYGRPAYNRPVYYGSNYSRPFYPYRTYGVATNYYSRPIVRSSPHHQHRHSSVGVSNWNRWNDGRSWSRSSGSSSSWQNRSRSSPFILNNRTSSSFRSPSVNIGSSTRASVGKSQRHRGHDRDRD